MTKIGKCLVVEHRAIKREPVTLRLPMPPSVNNLFASVKHLRIPTERYKNWRAEASNAVVQQGRPHVSGSVEVSITFDDCGTRMDLDNGVKATLDLLASMRVIDGDHKSIVRKLILAWGENKGALIRIVPAPPSARSAAA